ncbi:MAG: hypothetical protein CVV23_08130 [Ignavibacteriae bacterium HGW-Ignavibacteriae-2]|nr:hypothetical protein [Bacteroidota bacterium]PKL88859.1 MAG: hypothetical protein CVV23_08130 [Ignavibacteriae bacterium HGW-Ignavibacteriae-2]
MSETILNIYLVLENGHVTELRAKAYESDEGDGEKIKFLMSRSKDDFKGAYKFDAPTNSKGEFMKYNKFAKLEERGLHFQLFEEIFQKFQVPQNPLICVTPVVDGEILAKEI